MATTSVAVIGLSKLFREALESLLRRPRFTVATSSATLQEALATFAAHRPDLVICAVAGGEGVTERIQQLRELRIAIEGVRVVLLASPVSGSVVRDAASAGVQALLSKEITGVVLQRALELVMLGQQIFPAVLDEPSPRPAAALIPFTPCPQPHAQVVAASEPDPPGKLRQLTRFTPQSTVAPTPQRSTVLSERERQILACLVDGASNKTIARCLDITEATVKVHLKSLLRKIQVNNRTQAAVWGLNNNDLLTEPVVPLRESIFELRTDHQIAV